MGATQMQMLVRGYLTYELTESATLVGIVSAGGSVAVLVFALFGGAIADRVERRRVIQMGQGVSVILALVVGMAVLFDVIAWHHLLMAGIVQGIMWSFLAPCKAGFRAAARGNPEPWERHCTDGLGNERYGRHSAVHRGSAV